MVAATVPGHQGRRTESADVHDDVHEKVGNHGRDCDVHALGGQGRPADDNRGGHHHVAGVCDRGVCQYALNALLPQRRQIADGAGDGREDAHRQRQRLQQMLRLVEALPNVVTIRSNG